MFCIGVKEVQMSHWFDYCVHYWDSTGIFSHKIQLMPDHKPTIEHQRRLNQPMQEVVKKKIINWLDARIMYPITDSSSVCPVCVCPKRG